MFKGTLIEDHKYYNLRSKQLLYTIVPPIAIGLFANFYTVPIWVTLGACILYVALMMIISRNQKAMAKIAYKTIELSPTQITLKDPSGHQLETIALTKDATIGIKKKYEMAQETMNDITEEIKGNAKKHFIVLMQDEEERRFDFEINSYYMLTQLNKTVKLWQNEGHKIEYV